MSVFDELKARGMIAQMTNEEKIRDLMENQKIKFYIGFDPTADSLHVGPFRADYGDGAYAARRACADCAVRRRYRHDW